MSGRIKIYISFTLIVSAICCIKLCLPAPYINKEMENEFWIKKTFGTSKNNIVIGGDSRVYRGVSTRQLLKSTPELTAVNLGYSNGGINSEYLEFMKKRLDENAEIKVMLFGITPHSLLEKCAKNDHLMEVKSKSSSEIFSGLHYANFLKHFPPYTPFELFDDSSETYFIKYHNDGYAASDNLAGNFKYTYWKYWDTFKNEKVSDSLVDVFIKNIRKFQKQNIIIIAFEPPTTKHMKEIEHHHSGLIMDSLVRKLKSNNVHWIDVCDSLYESYDGSHIFHKDAERLSLHLGEQIKAILRQ